MMVRITLFPTMTVAVKPPVEIVSAIPMFLIDLPIDRIPLTILIGVWNGECGISLYGDLGIGRCHKKGLARVFCNNVIAQK
jgi:hypothetical protein